MYTIQRHSEKLGSNCHNYIGEAHVQRKCHSGPLCNERMGLQTRWKAAKMKHQAN